jgi:ribosome recycling factor
VIVFLFFVVRGIYMPQVTLKETITKKIEIPMDTLFELIDNLTAEERKKLLKKLKAKPVKLRPFKKDKLDSILADFAATNLYEDEFLNDLEEGLKKSSICL